jgi:hypothetical protein
MKQNSRGVALLVPLLAVSLILFAGIGFFVHRNSQQAKSVPTTETDPTANQTLNGDLANWKTYTNNKYKFKLKYPAGWNLHSSENNDHFNFLIKDEQKSGEYNYSNMLVIHNNYHIPLKSDLHEDAEKLINWTIKYVPSISYHSPKVTSTTKTTIDKLPAIKYTIALEHPTDLLPYTDIAFIYTYKNSELFSFELHGNNQKVMNQILSTFQFLD